MNMTKIAQACDDAQVNRLQEKLLHRCYGEDRITIRKRVSARYEETVQVMLARHGAEASVHMIDPDLHQNFSDCFKDENGCRPGSWSYEMTKAYMDKRYQ